MGYRKGCAIAALVLSVVCYSSAAAAAPIIFFGEDLSTGLDPANLTNAKAAQASFLSSLIGASVETFESFAVKKAPPYVVSFGSDTATLYGAPRDTTIGDNAGNGFGGTAFGRFAVSGSKFVETTSGLLLEFSTPQAAFGFFATDSSDFSGQLTLTFDDGAPLIIPHTVNSPNGTGLFFGFIDIANPFLTVRFGTTSGVDLFGFDDFTIARADQVIAPPSATVPEPASVSLLLFGSALAVLRRRTPRA